MRDKAERRPVTAMFCDLVGSTTLAATLDAEDCCDLVGAYLNDAANAIASTLVMSPKNSATGSWRCSEFRGRRRTTRSVRHVRD